MLITADPITRASTPQCTAPTAGQRKPGLPTQAQSAGEVRRPWSGGSGWLCGLLSGWYAGGRSWLASWLFQRPARAAGKASVGVDRDQHGDRERNDQAYPTQQFADQDRRVLHEEQQQ